MQYVIIALCFLCAVLLVLILLKLSGQGGRNSDLEGLSREVSGLGEALRRIEQEQTVASTRIDGLDRRSAQLNNLVDSRLVRFSNDNEKLARTVEGKLSDIQKDNEQFSALWSQVFVKQKDSSKGEYIASLVGHGITAFDTFLLVRKLLKNYRNLFGKKKR